MEEEKALAEKLEAERLQKLAEEEAKKKAQEEKEREAMFMANLQNNFKPNDRKDTIKNRDTITARRMTRKTFR